MNTNQKLTRIINELEAKRVTNERVEELKEMIDNGATIEDIEKWASARVNKLPEKPMKERSKGEVMADELIKRLEEMKKLPRNR